MNTSTETEMSSWKSKSEVAERMLREFELKYKAIKDQADRRGEELQEQRRLFANREDKFDR
jgi:predicted  nucleic acid-binding Zn-ribbon protein